MSSPVWRKARKHRWHWSIDSLSSAPKNKHMTGQKGYFDDPGSALDRGESEYKKLIVEAERWITTCQERLDLIAVERARLARAMENGYVRRHEDLMVLDWDVGAVAP